MNHDIRSRREVLGLLAAGVAWGAKTPAFPKKAIIRTILKDVPPEALAGGATLFHEHMSFTPEFMPKLMTVMFPGRAGRAPAATPPAGNAKYFMQDIDLMVDEISIARKE